MRIDSAADVGILPRAMIAVGRMAYELNGRRVLLTGASSGIGKELARELGRSGARLGVIARRANLLEDLAAQLTAAGAPPPTLIPADLSVPGTAAEAAERAIAELGVIDILINNAGSGVGGMQWMVGDCEAARATFETNVWSALALVQRLVPAMRERHSGVIVNVTSIAQVLTLWELGHYAASKAALAIATETRRLELTGSGVHVLEAVVGPTNTAVQGESRLIPGARDAMRSAPLGDPACLATLIVRGIRQQRRRVVYPRSYQLLFSFPALARAYMPLLAARLYRQGKLDTDDERVVRGGSLGDALAREARERWEREQLAAR